MDTYNLEFADKYLSDVTGDILEVGSRNVNGSVRDKVNVTVGVDMIDGDGVDIVLNACDVVEHFGEESFDCVISMNALEHSPEWKCFLQNMIGVLKTGKMLLVTAANLNKGVHNYPDDHWRLTDKMWMRVFRHQEIHVYFDSRVSNGVLVRKLSNKLDMDFEPMKPTDANRSGCKSKCEFRELM